jgi:hypothetical protein
VRSRSRGYVAVVETAPAVAPAMNDSVGGERGCFEKRACRPSVVKR